MLPTSDAPLMPGRVICTLAQGAEVVVVVVGSICSEK